MHKQIDLAQDRDFPVTKDTFNFNQEALREIINAIITSGSGDNDYLIITGVEVDGANHTNGWVVIEGELLPFVGGPTQTYVIIVETVTQAPWRETGGSIVNKDTYYERSVQFGTGTNQIALASFIRLEFARTRQNLANGFGYLGNANSPFGANFEASGTQGILHKDQFNRVHIQGKIQYTGSTREIDALGSPPTTTELVFTLAAAYRHTVPIFATYLYCWLDDVTNGVDRVLCRVTKADGVVEAIRGTLTEDHYYFIDFNFISE